MKNGKLIIWLRDRYADDLAEQVEQLDKTDPELAKKVSAIFDVPYDEGTQQDLERASERLKRLERIKQYTDERQFWEEIDHVAFEQDELYDLLDEGVKEIYLCGDSFEIPISKKGIHYIGINSPIVIIPSKTVVDWNERQIQIENVRWDAKYQKILEDVETLEIKKENTNSLLDLFMEMRFKEFLGKFDENEADDETYYMMYRIYLTGNVDVPANEKIAKAYLLEGYEKEYPICTVAYAHNANLQDDEKLKLFQKYKPILQDESQDGNILATHELGITYINKTDEDINYEKALQYFMKNMEKEGFWLSAYSIALRYHNGQGVERNYKTATEYYSYAVKYGHLWAYVYSLDLFHGWVDDSALKLEKARKAFYHASGYNSGKKILDMFIHDRMWFSKFEPSMKRSYPYWSSDVYSSRSKAENAYKNVQYDFAEETNQNFISEVDEYIDKFTKQQLKYLDLLIEEIKFCKQDKLAQIMCDITLSIDSLISMMKNSPAIQPCLDRYEVSDMQFNGLLGGHEVRINNYPENYNEQWVARREYVCERMPELYRQTIIDPVWKIINENWDESII